MAYATYHGREGFGFGESEPSALSRANHGLPLALTPPIDANVAGAAVSVGAVRRMPSGTLRGRPQRFGISKGSILRKTAQGLSVDSGRGREPMRDLPPPRAATQGA